MLSPILLISATLLTGITYGAPVDTDSALAKRGEGIHLVNCFATGSTADVVSAVAYCPNDGACKLGPSDFCTMSSGSSTQFFHWEGAPFHCTFPTGVTFSWALPSDAQGKATYSVVDTSASNGFRSWTGRKDDQHHVFDTQSGGLSCNSIYYYI